MKKAADLNQLPERHIPFPRQERMRVGNRQVGGLCNSLGINATVTRDACHVLTEGLNSFRHTEKLTLQTE